jgi:hypothetical protein
MMASGRSGGKEEESDDGRKDALNRMKHEYQALYSMP